MISRYEIFCKVVEAGSFTRVAGELGYSQSAVSQTIKALERELGVTLIDRKRDGMALTEDGRQFWPYLQAIRGAEEGLRQKEREMRGLGSGVIRIGTFTSVSRNLLPRLMKRFKEEHPTVAFILKQGEYTSIEQWVTEGSVDFGFVDANAVSRVEKQILYRDEMRAVLPQGHPLASQETLSLRQLAEEPFILLDEGEHSVVRSAFQKAGLVPRIEYEVYDDYSILAMVRQGLGVSAMYQLVLSGFEEGLEVRPIREEVERSVSLAWRNWQTMPLAARRFAEFILAYSGERSGE